MSGRTLQVAHTLSTYAVSRLVLGGLIGVLISRALGPEGRGNYALLLTVATIAVSVGHLSVDQSQVALWSRDSGRTAIAANAVLLGPAVGALSALATVTAVTALGTGALRVPGHGLLVAAVAAIPFSTTSLYLTGVLTLRGRIQSVNWSGMLGAAVHCTSLALLAATGRLSVEWAVVLWTVSAVVPLAVLVPAVRPRLRDRDMSLARRALGIGLRYHLGIVAFFLLLRVDILILGALRPAAEVGLYALAVALAELTRVTADSVAQVALARQMDGDDDSAAAFTLGTARLTALLSLCSVTLMCVVAPPLIPLVFGPAFSGSAAPLLCLAPGMWALGMIRPVSGFLLRLDRPLLMSSMSIAALSVNVGLGLALIPRFGVMGCAAAASIGYLALAAMQLGWLSHATRTPLRRLVPGRGDIRPLSAGLGAAWTVARSSVRHRVR